MSKGTIFHIQHCKTSWCGNINGLEWLFALSRHGFDELHLIASIIVFSFLNSSLLNFNFKRLDDDYFDLRMLVSLEDIELGILCIWFNIIHIHYGLKFFNHALCLMQFGWFVRLQEPTGPLKKIKEPMFSPTLETQHFSQLLTCPVVMGI